MLTIGWNIRYEFNDSDLETSKTILQMLYNEQEVIPWDALNFVTGHINYGGRVTDDWDRRCLLSNLKRFYSTDILENNYLYCEFRRFSESELYFIPKLGTVAEYLQYVNSLPIVDETQIFGMHENANTDFQSSESSRLVETIRDIQPKVGEKLLYF